MFDKPMVIIRVDARKYNSDDISSWIKETSLHAIVSPWRNVFYSTFDSRPSYTEWLVEEGEHEVWFKLKWK